jgi:hypothetical protein
MLLTGLVWLPLVYLVGERLTTLRRPGMVSSCPDWVLEQRYTTETVNPEEVVVEPLQGRHNVYAVFKLPEGYQPSPYFVVNLPNSQPYCGMISHAQGRERKTFVGLFRTRTTLWLMAKGQADQLNHRQNWSLAIVKRAS